MDTKQKKLIYTDADIRLLRSLAEELRLPLLQIARQAELASMKHSASSNMRVIEITAEAAIRLVDSYLFSTQILLGQQTLPLEPVSVSAAMQDTAQYLCKLARIYDCEIDVQVRGKCGLVMASTQGLQAALTSLVYTFIGSHPERKRQRIVLTARRDGRAVVAGVMANNMLEKNILADARQLYGRAHQPAATMTHKSGAGIYIADSLFRSMSTELQVFHHRKYAGLAATLLPSYQTTLL